MTARRVVIPVHKAPIKFFLKFFKYLALEIQIGMLPLEATVMCERSFLTHMHPPVIIDVIKNALALLFGF